MLDTDPSFRPVRARDGYPLLEDLGLIGDGADPDQEARRHSVHRLHQRRPVGNSDGHAGRGAVT